MQLFSLIIPTYNSSKTIRNCLKSIALQTFRNFEVLIIDALSTDQTLEIVKEFDNRISFDILSQSDTGIYDAMNKGIFKAKGDYLYFLGSDDTLFDPEVLQNVANQITLTNCKIIYGNVRMQGYNELVKDGTIYGGAFDLKRLLNFNIPHQAIFYHKTVFHIIGTYNLKYKIFADHDLNLRAIVKYKFRYIDQIVANFTVGGSSSVHMDENFEKDKIRNFVSYFASKIHTNKFIPLRYYIKEAAFNSTYKVNPIMRIYCMLIYSKLKLLSLIY
ncbi:glycosyltransferase family 2 protein [Pedobacter mucosus]|uniref:glycosyltransferase family 2 protein n=1 Tax=Pedobacter mucosus TaxID=2895286 RepID=UPI001EE441F8|nr:glycosyltransferase family 2 protein [Pedobacter mucosus]UKT64399.1 glycosyltransferase [Pedobacter mucosus]